MHNVLGSAFLASFVAMNNFTNDVTVWEASTEDGMMVESTMNRSLAK